MTQIVIAIKSGNAFLNQHTFMLSDERLNDLLKFAESISSDDIDDSKVDLAGLEESISQAIQIQKGELPRRTIKDMLGNGK